MGRSRRNNAQPLPFLRILRNARLTEDVAGRAIDEHAEILDVDAALARERGLRRIAVVAERIVGDDGPERDGPLLGVEDRDVAALLLEEPLCTSAVKPRVLTILPRHRIGELTGIQRRTAAKRQE